MLSEHFPNRLHLRPTGSAGPGNLHSQSSAFGFDGGYYYLRLNYSWGAIF